MRKRFFDNNLGFSGLMRGILLLLSFIGHSAKNEIRNLKDAQGTPIREDQLVDAAWLFFSGLLSAGCTCESIPSDRFVGGVTDEDNRGLIALATLDELRSTIWSMNKEKALGPDGSTLCFFHASWDVVKDDFLCVVNNFL